VHRVARLAFFRPNLKNLESFQVGWPKKIWLAVWPVCGLILSQLALKMCLTFWLFFGFFHAGIDSYEGKYCYSIFLATNLQTFVINSISDAAF